MQRRHQRRDRRRIAVRLVDQRRTPGPRQPRQQRRHAEVAREDRRRPRRRQAVAHGRGEVVRAPQRRRPGHRDARDREAVDRVEAVEGERIAGVGGGVGPDEQRHAMPARRQRVTRRHRLQAVRALERQPDVRQVQQVHGSYWPVGGGAGGGVGDRRRRVEGVPREDVAVDELGQAARDGHERMVRVVGQRQPLPIHQPAAELRHQAEVPPGPQDEQRHHRHPDARGPRVARQPPRRSAIGHSPARPTRKTAERPTKRRCPKAPATVHDSTLPAT